MAELHVSILTPAKVVAKTTAHLVELPGVLGYMGILPGHAPLISELAVGTLTLESGGTKQYFFVSGGYVEVANDQVTVLADIAEKPGDIDVKRAEAAKSVASERLAKMGDVDYVAEQAAIKRADERLAVARRAGS